jgi:hypothetical protein
MKAAGSTPECSANSECTREAIGSLLPHRWATPTGRRAARSDPRDVRASARSASYPARRRVSRPMSSARPLTRDPPRAATARRADYAGGFDVNAGPVDQGVGPGRRGRPDRQRDDRHHHDPGVGQGALRIAWVLLHEQPVDSRLPQPQEQLSPFPRTARSQVVHPGRLTVDPRDARTQAKARRPRYCARKLQAEHAPRL